MSSRRGAPQRVDPDWRGQVADYLLGQQTGPEGTATRGHLKRSEPARLWALSLLDSLDHLYDERDLPVIPEGEAAPLASPRRKLSRARGARARPGAAARPLLCAPDAGRTPGTPAVRGRRDDRAPPPDRRRSGRRDGAPLPPARVARRPPDRRRRRRRRRDDSSDQAEDAAAGRRAAPAAPAERREGRGHRADHGARRRALAARPGARAQADAAQGQAYEVWLFNSQGDADVDGRPAHRPAGQLPGRRAACRENYEDFEFLDISRENVDQNAAHSGDSVLRGRLADLQAAHRRRVRASWRSQRRRGRRRARFRAVAPTWGATAPFLGKSCVGWRRAYTSAIRTRACGSCIERAPCTAMPTSSARARRLTRPSRGRRSSSPMCVVLDYRTAVGNIEETVASIKDAEPRQRRSSCTRASRAI